MSENKTENLNETNKTTKTEEKKGIFTKIGDGLKATGKFLKENWKTIALSALAGGAMVYVGGKVIEAANEQQAIPTTGTITPAATPAIAPVMNPMDEFVVPSASTMVPFAEPAPVAPVNPVETTTI